MRNSIGLLLTKRAQMNPASEAVVEVERDSRCSYEELNRRANRMAHALVSRGVKKGDRIALLMKNCVEFVESYFAIAKIGAVMVPLNWRLVADELEFIVRDSGSSVFLSDFDCQGLVEALHNRKTSVRSWIHVGDSGSHLAFAEDYESCLRDASDEEPAAIGADDDLFFIMYTSGTTGLPKGAMHTHESMTWMSLTVNMTCDIRHRDRDLTILPLFHIGALLPLTIVLHRGGTAVILRSFDPVRIFQTFERERINTMWGVATTLRLMLDCPEREKYDCSSVRWIVGGGEPVPASLIQKYAQMGIAILQDYGLTESGPVTIISPEDALKKAGSVGRPYVHTEVRVVDSAGTDAAPGVVGEIIVRGRHNMAGYWNLPEATSQTIREGWLYTGDLATFDDEGFLFVRGRKKDMIISGGENIYLAELEKIIQSHPSVKEAAAIGQPSAKWGESPVAVVVLSDDDPLSKDELITYCRAKLAGFKVPRVVEFVSSLPRTSTGKVQKHVLRERFPGPAPQ